MENFDFIRPEFVQRILDEKPYAIQYIKHPDENIVCQAIIKSPEICVYLNEITEKMLCVLKEHHPNYYSLYKNNLVQ